MKKITVFIVEDSVLMQKIIIDMLSGDPDIEVVGNAKSGKEALEKIPLAKPDVVTLDFNLPDIDGLVILRKLLKILPVRVMMLSAHTQKEAEITIKALEAGALDFLPKPTGEISLDLYTFKDEIISKIKLVAAIDLEKYFSSLREIKPVKDELIVKKLVVIGASTGGPKAVIDIMNLMPPNLGAAFLIVQHMPKGFTKSFAERISWSSNIKTKEAQDGDFVVKNAAYVAPSGFHMILAKNPTGEGYCVNLDDAPLVNYVRPAVDTTLFSVAENFSGDIITVILTGMGKDGLDGVKKIKQRGGKVIAQNEASCVVYGMPRVIVKEGLADEVLHIDDIPKKITEYLTHG